MRLRRLAALVPLLLLAVTTVAQESPAPKTDPAVKLNNLYRQMGRAWGYKITAWTRAEGVEIATESATVLAVGEEDASCSAEGESADGSTRWTQTNTYRFDSQDELHLADAALPCEDVDTGFGVMRCKRHSATENDRQVTSWVSMEYHPLIVKQVELGVDYCRVKKLTSFASGETDPFLLYRMKGRRWLLKSSVSLGGGDPIVNYTRNEVTAVTATSAKTKMWLLDKDQKPMAGMEGGTDLEIAFTVAAEQPRVAPGAAQPKQEKRKCTAGEFDCVFTEAAGTKSWSSTRWPGLPVYMESGTVTMELVEFDLGHDAMGAYRTAGNNWTIKNNLTLAGGMKMETYQRTEVTAVEGGKAKTLFLTLDANKRETFRSNTEVPVTEAAKPLCAYTGQVEELLTTPAGALPCLVQETDQGMKMWMYHGVMVRAEMKQEGFSSVMELTELTLK